jgi:hypothetical protein
MRHCCSDAVPLLVTSCFPGGWVIKPSCGLSGARPLLNMTTMAAAGAGRKDISWAWDSSDSCGRATGSVYATALRQSLIQMEGHRFQRPAITPGLTRDLCS